MTVTKHELEKIYREYHNQDVLRDKFIEDEAQYYTYAWVFDQLASVKSILELGYGEGNFTAEVVKRGFDVTVVDGSESLLKKAKALHGDKISCAHDLFEDFKPTTTYDCILATHVLEHIDDPVGLLKTMTGWLTPGGKIIVIVPNQESIHRQLAVRMGLQPKLDTLSPRDQLVGHQRVYSLTSLSRDVTAAGLRVTETAGFFLKPLPNSMMLDYSLELVRALNAISPAVPKHLLANIGLVAEL